MNVCPVLPSEAVLSALQASMERCNRTWAEIADWYRQGRACFWQIGNDAFVLTVAEGDNTIDILLAGGGGAIAAARPFEKAMLSLPEHAGKTLRIEGRAGWRRFYQDWDFEETEGGNVILTKVCDG